MEPVRYEDLTREEQYEVCKLDNLFYCVNYTDEFSKLKSSDYSLRAWQAFLHGKPTAFPYITDPSDDIINYAIYREGVNILYLSEEQQTLQRVIIALKGWDGRYWDSELKSPVMQVVSAELRKLYKKINDTEMMLYQALHQAKMRELDSNRRY